MIVNILDVNNTTIQCWRSQEVIRASMDIDTIQRTIGLGSWLEEQVPLTVRDLVRQAMANRINHKIFIRQQMKETTYDAFAGHVAALLQQLVREGRLDPLL